MQAYISRGHLDPCFGSQPHLIYHYYEKFQNGSLGDKEIANVAQYLPMTGNFESLVIRDLGIVPETIESNKVDNPHHSQSAVRKILTTFKNKYPTDSKMVLYSP